MNYEDIYHAASDDDSVQYEEESDSDLEPVDLEDPQGQLELLEFTDLQVDDAAAKYLKSLEDKLQDGTIDDYSFMLEKLLIDYRNLVTNNTFDITDPGDQAKIEKIKQYKAELLQEYKTATITESNELDRKYYNLLKLEYELLLVYKDTKGIKIKYQDIRSTQDKLKSLIESEEENLKKIAKKKNIIWPDRPQITTDRPLIKIKKLLTYHLELRTAMNLAKQFIPSYKISSVFTDKSGHLRFEEEIPTIIRYDKLKRTFYEEKKSLEISELDRLKFESTRSLLFKAQHFDEYLVPDKPDASRLKFREKLLECITDNYLINKMSYIEKLRQNTVPVMKFREYPETYEKLQAILGEEAKYYKITEIDLLKDFNKTFINPTPDIILDVLPSTFRPVRAVKINEQHMKTELPDYFQKELQKQYPQEHPVTGYSFLLKIKEVPNPKPHKKINKYVEIGSLVSLSLKPEYFKYFGPPPEVLDEKYYSIIKPLSDDLYTELKHKFPSSLHLRKDALHVLSSNNTDIIPMYELHITVPELSAQKDTKLVRRYEEFEDYLRDLLEILKANVLTLENGGYLHSVDILRMKIRKIELYLEDGKDHEYEINNEYSLEETVAEKSSFIEYQRKLGKIKLKEYILNFYPENDEQILDLENNIYEFNNKFYIENVNKILFIFSEDEDTLRDYMDGTLEFIKLISKEITKIKPDNDLPEYFTNPKATFHYLYKWMPEVAGYLQYSEELTQINNNILEFKRLHPNLNQLQINEIYFQMIEYKRWEESKLRLNTIIIPKKKDPIRVMLLFLKRQRNQLTSRRIFRPATIIERIDARDYI